MKLFNRLCEIWPVVAAAVFLAFAALLPAQPTTQPNYSKTPNSSQPAYRWTLPVELRVTASHTYWPDARIDESRAAATAIADAHLTEIDWTIKRIRGPYTFGDTSGGFRKWGDFAETQRDRSRVVVYLVQTLPAGQPFIWAWQTGDPVGVAASPYDKHALAFAILRSIQAPDPPEGSAVWWKRWSPYDARNDYAAWWTADKNPWPIETWTCGWVRGMERRGVATTQGVNQ